MPAVVVQRLPPFGDEVHNDGTPLVRVEHPRVLRYRALYPLKRVRRVAHGDVAAAGYIERLHEAGGELLPLRRLLETQVLGDVAHVEDEVSLFLEEVVPRPLRLGELPDDVPVLVVLARLRCLRFAALSLLLLPPDLVRDESICLALLPQHAEPSFLLVGAPGANNEHVQLILHVEHVGVLVLGRLPDVSPLEGHRPPQSSALVGVNVEAV
mmetsp:Transcript_20823/g.60617  ORF Transcript_20823/g.60617 Transcript_20823/m.60617 type:complete len:211 (+) Transcript_20823:2240-2872(+)